MKDKWEMFDPCIDGECDGCIGEFCEEINGLDGGVDWRWTRCECSCHIEWEPDRAYAAGMAYACGYHD